MTSLTTRIVLLTFALGLGAFIRSAQQDTTGLWQAAAEKIHAVAEAGLR